MKIAIAGIGYVGLSNSMLLAQHNEVIQRVISNRSVVTLNVVIFLRDTPLDKQELNTF